MEEILKKELGAATELIPGAGGIFDVAQDGELIFSKFKTGRFPEPEEIISLLRQR